MGMGPTVLTLGTLLLRISPSKEAFSVTRLAEEEEVTLGVRFHRKSLVLTDVMCRYKRAARDRRKEVVGWSKGLTNLDCWKVWPNLNPAGWVWTWFASDQLERSAVGWGERSWYQDNYIQERVSFLCFGQNRDPWYPTTVTKVSNNAIISKKGSLFIVLEKKKIETSNIQKWWPKLATM